MKTSEPRQVFDQYLVIRAAAGSAEAFEKLVRDWTPRLVRFAGGILGGTDAGRDVVQETWLAAIRGLRTLDDPASFPGWIYGITRRKCIDAIRAKQRRQRLTEHIRRDAQAQEDAGTGASDAGSENVLAAMSRLSEEQREVVSLYYGEELGIDAIAAVIGVPTGTVKSRLFHARATLKKLLGESP